MLKRYTSCKKGMALAMVIMLMAVFTILGAVILQIALADTKHAAWDKKRMQAFYLAKSGVEATATWMMTPGNDGPSLFGKTSPYTILDAGVAGKFKVEVQPSDPVNPANSAIIRVIGTGNVDGVTNKAIFELRKLGSGGGGPFSNLISATSNINYGGTSDLSGGNIVAQGTINQSGAGLLTGGSAYPNTPINAPPIMFPADPSTAPDKAYAGNSSSVFNIDIAADPDKMLVYDEFTNNNGKIIVNTGAAGDIVKLVVRDIKLGTGDFELSGYGKLHLFVTEEADLRSLHINATGTPQDADRMLVFLKDGVNFKLSGNDSAYMCIYGPGANVTTVGCNSFVGSVLGLNVNCSGTSSLYYPFTSTTIEFEDLPVFYYGSGLWINP